MYTNNQINDHVSGRAHPAKTEMKDCATTNERLSIAFSRRERVFRKATPRWQESAKVESTIRSRGVSD